MQNKKILILRDDSDYVHNKDYLIIQDHCWFSLPSKLFKQKFKINQLNLSSIQKMFVILPSAVQLFIRISLIRIIRIFFISLVTNLHLFFFLNIYTFCQKHLRMIVDIVSINWINQYNWWTNTVRTFFWCF